jgi:peptidoglycan hydrolase FlgJ
METNNAQYESARVFHDFNSLAQLKSQGRNGGKDDPAAIREAAKQFESIFTRMMLKSMRDASQALIDEPMFDSAHMNMFKDMHDDQLSLHLSTSQGQGVGLTEVLVEQLSGIKGAVKASSKKNSDQPVAAQPAMAINQADIALAQIAHQQQSQAITNAKPAVIAQEVSSASITASNTTSAVTSDVTSAVASEQPANNERGVDFSSPSAFVKSLWPYAKAAAEKLSLDPKLLIAQAALETGWGKHVMRDTNGQSSNNLFGIKAGQSWNGKVAQVASLEHNGVALVKQHSTFKAYSDYQQSFEDFINFLKQGSRYQQALEVTEQPEKFTQELQKAGYATDPEYAQKILGVYQSPTLANALSQVEAEE